MQFLSRFAVILAVGVALTCAAPASGQAATGAKGGVADDWSHHRLIFSNPGTAEDAVRNGWYGQWLKIVNDPRYQLQERKRSYRPMGAPGTAWKGFGGLPGWGADGENGAPGAVDPVDPKHLPRGLVKAPSTRRWLLLFERGRRPTSQRVHADWSENMGSGATAGLGVYPAKFSFTTTSANCASAATPDYVAYNTGLVGSSGQASIMAYDNLYSGCAGGGAGPSVYWAYNTNGGAVTTSVVLALDGSQLAFAQNTGGVASLVALKWAASGSESAGSPDSLSVTPAGSYLGCSAPCMTSLTFSGGANDSGSAPFYDYSSDTLYVGDDSGKLHKFTGVFNGTPTEAGSPWPVTVSAAALNGPVYDSGSGNILVGDYLLNQGSTCASVANPCGYFYAVNASSGAVVGTSHQLDYVFGIVESPVVDSAAGMAYVFVGADGEIGKPSACGSEAPCSGVFQFPVNFANGSSGTEATVGPGYSFLLAGSFDEAYLTSAPGSPSGHMYVVGDTGAANNTLYQVTIHSNVMNTASTAGPVVSENYFNGFMAAGLGVTEFENSGHDYIFLSVLSYGAPAACSSTLANGCVMGFDVTSGSISASTAPTAATTEAGGTSSIIIDNSAALAGASNIYFTPLADQLCATSGTIGGCAIQTLQSAP